VHFEFYDPVFSERVRWEKWFENADRREVVIV
jgi:hypothetical protein